MKRAKTFYASRGLLTAQGASKAEAKADLESQVDWALRHAGPKIEMRYGLMIVIAADPCGWTHTVLDPAEMKHGQERHCSCHHGQREYIDVLESARSHAAQIAWTHDVADDSAFVAMAGLTEPKACELARWIEWQRNYKRLRAEGKSDNEARHAA